MDITTARKVIAFMRVETYMHASLFTLGFVGNLAMVAIYSRKRLSKLSVSTYIRAMVLAHLVINTQSLLLLAITRLKHMEHMEVISFSEVTCRFFMFFFSLTSPLSAWFEVAASCDRFVTIVYSNRFNFIEKPWFRRLVVVVIVSAIVLINSHLMFDFFLITNYDPRKRTNESVCTTYPNNPINYIDFANSVVVPFVFMVVLSSATIWGVLKSRQHSRRSSRQRPRSRDVRFAVTMICLNAVFFVCNAPIRLAFIVNITPFSSTTQLYETYVFMAFVRLLADSQYSVGFYVQLAVNKLVRKEVYNFVVSRRRRATNRPRKAPRSSLAVGSSHN